ncbi:NAD(P)/FAD-dependent oxidoreductase [Pseudodonghicola flavimaris]|uniref:FAD-dependent oxidoreductase n=1 Tax=Pseudodonghicola flavimaris TaxID=3050036 RepID=A0ABT7EXM7_9RHOB|nr:FAD-dependent oxidoreductase [Pseudodonghicola flavimaris]MDK3017101.1 FAD-dependent oxidoreductase [Pseudodonghicola flavimaris]
MTATETSADVIVIGAGMAGASVAAELSRAARVVLVERETQPGYHTTGRSAALFTMAYGPAAIRALSRASYEFYRGEGPGNPPADLIRTRGVVFIARADQQAALDGMAAELGRAVEPISAAAARDLQPLLRQDYVAAALFDREAADIEVHGLHQFYLRAFKANAGALHLRSEVLGLGRSGADWMVETRLGRLRAPVVVNASGAWADEVAGMAGLRPLGLRPLRRTAMLVSPPAGRNPDGWPMVVDCEEAFYMKPDAGKLLLSPADETLSAPCDAQPEEMDIAICVDRIETAFDIQVRRIEHKWAGLRSFLPDGNPAVGFDPEAPGFFWLAGQGGYGIQTAPAMARYAAALVRGAAVPGDIEAEGLGPDSLSPARPELAA